MNVKKFIVKLLVNSSWNRKIILESYVKVQKNHYVVQKTETEQNFIIHTILVAKGLYWSVGYMNKIMQVRKLEI